MNEILPGMKVLKLYAWEIPFINRVKTVRDKEIKILKYLGKIWALTNFTFACSPFLVTVMVFILYVYTDPINHILDANKIFVSISIFGIMRLPLTLLPWAFTESVKVYVSLKRINKYLNSEEMDQNIIGDDVQDPSNILEIKNASFLKNKLNGINVEVKTGSLTAIVGAVGSGKSLFLSSILGELDKTSGSIDLNSKNELKIAYVPQQAWIQNMTLKNNILFGQKFNPTEYSKVIESCALKADLEMLTAGDLTEIGESGINLSGGQKQRVGIARAVYSNADLYLFDDPLSAVDAHVGKHLFEKILHSKTGILRSKTRLIVTNSLSILKDVDQVLVMQDGCISEQGTYQELLNNKGAFAEYLSQYLNCEDLNNAKFDEDNSRPLNHVPNTIPPKPTSRSVSICSDTIYGSTPTSIRLALSRRESLTDSLDNELLPNRISTRDESSANANNPNDETGRLIEEEAALTGRVKYGVYVDYFKSFGILASVIVLCFYILGQSLHSFSNVWLSVWSDFNDVHNETEITENLSYYLGIYGGIGGFESAIEFTREMILFFCCAGASKVIHQRLLNRVMRSPMSFFDTNPTGRIINRFSADIDKIDLTIPFIFSDFLWCACEVVAVLVIISYSTPEFLYVIIPLFVLYFFVQRYYIKSSRQLKRLESISKSPIYSHFTESVNGAMTIRAFKQTERFMMESESKVAANVSSNYYNYSSNRWLGLRIETLGTFIICFASLFAILNRDTLSPGLAGLSISYSMQITDTLTWMVRMLCELETNSVSLERVLEYINENPQEANWESDYSDQPGHDWPQDGKIQFSNYHTQFRPGLDFVLKGISMNIDKQTKVGICGRTGAGKSSLTLSLFRIIEPIKGSILIDGLDISKMGLHDLRSRLTIIPQDPVLFTGNIRFNLDPTGIQSDANLWSALENAHLKNHIETLEGGLDYEVTEGGSNFSVGQRQLICLARALLRKTKILVLDEATAAIGEYKSKTCKQ